MWKGFRMPLNTSKWGDVSARMAIARGHDPQGPAQGPSQGPARGLCQLLVCTCLFVQVVLHPCFCGLLEELRSVCLCSSTCASLSPGHLAHVNTRFVRAILLPCLTQLGSSRHAVARACRPHAVAHTSRPHGALAHFLRACRSSRKRRSAP